MRHSGIPSQRCSTETARAFHLRHRLNPELGNDLRQFEPWHVTIWHRWVPFLRLCDEEAAASVPVCSARSALWHASEMSALGGPPMQDRTASAKNQSAILLPALNQDAGPRPLK